MSKYKKQQMLARQYNILNIIVEKNWFTTYKV